MALRTYSTLVSLFPHLGPNGAYAEGKAASLPGGMAAGLIATHSSYSPVLCDAVTFWTENNVRVMSFIVDEDQSGTLDAFCKVFSLRRSWLETHGHAVGAIADSLALRWATRVKLMADQLLHAKKPLSTPVGHIYRGEAIDAASVHASYGAGKTVTWDLPKACTLNHDVVPLHFAWKQFGSLATPAGVVLDIELDPLGATSLLWAGWVAPSGGRADMRWQQEVIVAPNFSFKVTSCIQLHAAGGFLYEVKAKEI